MAKRRAAFLVELTRCRAPRSVTHVPIRI
jgi:hypothetical protein